MITTTLHDGCVDCEALVRSSETMARVTGSVGSSSSADHRDPSTGEIVIDHVGSWSRESHDNDLQRTRMG